jgi:hypothetical protein
VGWNIPDGFVVVSAVVSYHCSQEKVTMPCKLILKDGKHIEVDLSATQVKHLRRGKKRIPMYDEDRQLAYLDTTNIRQVIAL